MKRKNLYYLTVFKRVNLIKVAILGFFLAIASWPRLILEVFFRRKMGERYFSLATSITLFVLMFFGSNLPHYSYYGGWSFPDPSEIFSKSPSLSLFALAFLAMSIMRYKEIKREPGVFDFAKFSMYSGDILPFFYNIKINGTEPTRKTIATIYEPLVGFIIGVLLTLFHSPVGIILMVCSIIYSVSYCGAHYQGDQFLMDMIDEMLCNEDLTETLVEGTRPEDKRGVEFFGTPPNNKKFRRVLAETIVESEEASDVY
ncbi:hypothetical protein CKK33_06495 [Mucilaginibacter sp. MD40]|uniref:hypothetical protein n=1 Tax=Mucilaginibacter sp. MD40 TaxID=2029590 RepID=UPI000BACC1E0|nr:hypothetical protein [Mucilaginibacter sp. MD40]PAW93161.1 hypothetical protein CKK33_06495 [Mucilaginibacter sp. MD40]